MATKELATARDEDSVPRDDRARYGLIVVIAGLAGVLFAFWLALGSYDFTGSIATAAASSSAVAAVLAPVTTVIGTIVGAYFGYRAGAEGKEKAEQRRDEAEKKTRQLAAVAPPRIAGPILGVDSTLIGNPDTL